MRFLGKATVAAGFVAAIACSAATSRAAIVQLDANGAAAGLLGSNNDCGMGGFGNCWATQTGVIKNQVTMPTDPLSSRVIYKRDSAGSNQQPTGLQDYGTGVPNTYGNRFSITYNSTDHVLAFTYTPSIGDHILHYFSIKQGQHYALFYDVDPITTYSVDLDTLGFTNNKGKPNVGWSHITFFNGGLYEPPPPPPPPPPTGVAEPASLALLGAGLLGLGLVRRRRA